MFNKQFECPMCGGNVVHIILQQHGKRLICDKCNEEYLSVSDKRSYLSEQQKRKLVFKHNKN